MSHVVVNYATQCCAVSTFAQYLQWCITMGSGVSPFRIPHFQTSHTKCPSPLLPMCLIVLHAFLCRLSYNSGTYNCNSKHEMVSPGLGLLMRLQSSKCSTLLSFWCIEVCSVPPIVHLGFACSALPAYLLQWRYCTLGLLQIHTGVDSGS